MTKTMTIERAEAVSRRLADLATEAGIEIVDPLHISVGDLIVDCAARGVDPVQLMQRAEDDTPGTKPVQHEHLLAEVGEQIIPCTEPHCIWTGGHVAPDDEAVVHTAHERRLSADTLVAVEKCIIDSPMWLVYGHLEDDGRITSAEAFTFAAALVEAEQVAGRLNEEAGK